MTTTFETVMSRASWRAGRVLAKWIGRMPSDRREARIGHAFRHGVNAAEAHTRRERLAGGR